MMYVSSRWARRCMASVGVVISLSGCTAFNTKVVDPVITAIAKLNAKGILDLQLAEKVANAANPIDTDGYNCAAAAITVIQSNDKVLVAAGWTIDETTGTATAPATSNAGVATAAELASLIEPGSAQYKWVVNTLGSGCIAKANDLMGGPAAVLAAGGVFTLISNGTLLPALGA